MSRADQAPQTFAASTRPVRRIAVVGTSAGEMFRTWCRRSRNAGLALSCLFHALIFVGLAFCVLAAPRASDPVDVNTAAFQRPDAGALEFELGPADSVGGGGGLTPAVDESDIPNATTMGSDAGMRIPPPLAVPETPVAGMNPGAGLGHGRGTSRGDGTGKPAGKNAVTKGSFTVWTIPDDPLPGENYTIMIEVKLPEKTTRYSCHDLVGLVTGTDGWQQPIPGNAYSQQSWLPVRNQTAQLEIEVPGAGRRIRDTIEVRSKLLKEEQVLKIAF